MKFDKQALRLYAVTDRMWLKDHSLAHEVEQAILGGVTFVQLREKHLKYQDFCQLAKEIQQVTNQYHIPLVINDQVDVAIAVNADGVHVGQSDMPASEIRHLLGPDKIIGVSVQTMKQALLAEAQGADYLGVGAVFPTATKEDADFVSYNTLKEICASTSIPVVAIGGITAENIHTLSGTGIDGIAVVSALFAQKDIREAAIQLRAQCDQM